MTYSKDVNCGLIAVYRELASALKNLETIGIIFNIDGLETPIYFVVSFFTGDNLGLNTILGFTRTFRGSFCCRICLADEDQIKTLVEEIDELLRRNSDREDGIKEIFAFEEIPSVYLVDCVAVDIFHDFNEGILHTEICHVLKSFIDAGKIDIASLNHKKNHFEYYMTNEKKKMCQDIKRTHINENHFKMSGSQISTFFKYLPLTIGEFIEEGNEEWSLLILLYDLLNSVHKETYNDTELISLKNVIKCHHEKYQQLYGNFIFKHHIITHYPSVIRLLGPLIFMSTVRMESFHQLLKDYSRVTRNHQNILYSLCDKLEFHNAYNIYKNNEAKTNEKANIFLRQKITMSNVDDSVKPLLSNNTQLYGQCINFNTTYNIDDIFTCLIDLEEDFYKICYISGECDELFFICKKILIIGYDNHIKCHIVKPDCNAVFIKINIKSVNSLPCKMFKYSIDNCFHNKNYYVIVDCNF